jgi:hypothetical protein
MAKDWRTIYPSSLVDGVAGLPQKQRLGTSRFLTWLARQSDDPRSMRLMDAICQQAGVATGNAVTLEREFFDIITRWRDEHLADPAGTTSDVMRAQDVSAAMHGLIHLRDSGLCAIPSGFKPRMVTIGRKEGDGWPSLGEADWPELHGLRPTERERRAMEMVREAFLAMFQRGASIYRRANDILQIDNPDVAEAAVRDSILAYRDHIRRTGGVTDDGSLKAILLRDRDVWRQAGFEGLLRNGATHTDILLAHRECLGPSTTTMMGAFGVFACDTGWNVQPIKDLPRKPYVFHSTDAAFLAEEAFVESFKRRAGHHVVAYLGNGHDVSAAKTAIMRERWSEAVQADGRDSVQAMLERQDGSGGQSALEVLEAYRGMAEDLRETIGEQGSLGLGLWIYVSTKDTVRSLMDFAPNAGPTGGGAARIYPPDSVLTRKGFGFRSIRKSWLILNRHDTGSVHATRTAASHSSTSVLLPHYLNTPSVNAELDESVRQFQDAMQALITRDRKEAATVKLGVPVDQLQRLRRLADEAGITAALGLDQRAEADVTIAPLAFRPTAENLKELFLIHRELRRIQHEGENIMRFRTRHLPLLALCKAIGREVFARHLGPAYRSAARAAAAEVRDGVLSAPSIED